MLAVRRLACVTTRTWCVWRHRHNTEFQKRRVTGPSQCCRRWRRRCSMAVGLCGAPPVNIVAPRPLRMKIDPASLLVLPCSIEFGQYRCPCPSAVPADGEKCSRQASVLELLAQIAHVGGWRRQLSTSRWPGPRYAVVYPLIASRMLLADAWCVGVSSSCVTVASFRSALPRVPASPRMALCPDESISGCKIMLSHPSERSYLACYLASLTWMPGQPGH